MDQKIDLEYLQSRQQKPLPDTLSFNFSFGVYPASNLKSAVSTLAKIEEEKDPNSLTMWSVFEIHLDGFYLILGYGERVFSVFKLYNVDFGMLIDFQLYDDETVFKFAFKLKEFDQLLQSKARDNDQICICKYKDIDHIFFYIGSDRNIRGLAIKEMDAEFDTLRHFLAVSPICCVTIDSSRLKEDFIKFLSASKDEDQPVTVTIEIIKDGVIFTAGKEQKLIYSTEKEECINEMKLQRKDALERYVAKVSGMKGEPISQCCSWNEKAKLNVLASYQENRISDHIITWGFSIFNSSTYSGVSTSQLCGIFFGYYPSSYTIQPPSLLPDVI